MNYLVARWAPGVIAPHALALGRWCVAALILGAFCHREIAAKRSAVATEWRHLLVLGAFGMWICGSFVYIGGRSTTAINIGLLYAATPVLIVCASVLFLRERVGVRQGLGVALGLAGVLHVVLRGDWPALAQLRVNIGDAWVAGAVVSWTAYSLLLRAWPSAFSPIARLTLTGCFGCVVLIPFTLAEARCPPSGRGRVSGSCLRRHSCRVPAPMARTPTCSAHWVWRAPASCNTWGLCTVRQSLGQCWANASKCSMALAPC